MSKSTLPHLKTKKYFSDLEEWGVKPIFKRQKYQSFKTLGNYTLVKKVLVMSDKTKKEML